MLPPEEALRQSALLDARYHALRGDMDRTKELTLAALLEVLERARTPYALIGGVAVQLWRSEPRTTLDIDIAVTSYDAIPRAELLAAGFTGGTKHPHSENWAGPDGVPVQFTDDVALAAAVATAVERTAGKLAIRVATPLELVRAKLRAAADPARRRSKMLMDLADAQGLVEDHADVWDALSATERETLGK